MRSKTRKVACSCPKDPKGKITQQTFHIYYIHDRRPDMMQVLRNWLHDSNYLLVYQQIRYEDWAILHLPNYKCPQETERRTSNTQTQYQENYTRTI